MNKKSILILESKHMISILLFLSNNDGCMKTELYSAVSNNPRMPEKLDDLESAGLLRLERNSESRAVRIYLTKLGASIGRSLQDIDRKMSEL